MASELTRSLVEEGTIIGDPRSDEYFQSLGIHPDDSLPCFACDEPKSIVSLTAVVRTEQAGERIVAMLRHRPQLDHRGPDWNRIKIGACQKHYPNLDALSDFTLSIGNRLPEFAVQRIVTEEFDTPPRAG